MCLKRILSLKKCTKPVIIINFSSCLLLTMSSRPNSPFLARSNSPSFSQMERSVSPSDWSPAPVPDHPVQPHHIAAWLGAALICKAATAPLRTRALAPLHSGSHPWACTLCAYLGCEDPSEHLNDTLICNCGKEHEIPVCPWCFVSFPQFHEVGRLKSANDSRRK